MSNKIITQEELSEVKYGDLLEKFTELGIPEVWKRGKKKISMIESAIEKLKIKSNLESQGLQQDEVEKELKEIELKKEKAVQDAQLQKAIEAEEKDKQIVKQVVESKLTKEQIEYNLDNIRKNLINVIPTHRIVLLKKQELLEKMLSEL